MHRMRARPKGADHRPCLSQLAVVYIDKNQVHFPEEDRPVPKLPAVARTKLAKSLKKQLEPFDLRVCHTEGLSRVLGHERVFVVGGGGGGYGVHRNQA